MKYYKFSQRGFSNEYTLVGCSNEEKAIELKDEFIDEYGANAKVWNVKAKTLSRKDKAFMAVDKYEITTDEWYQMEATYYEN